MTTDPGHVVPDAPWWDLHSDRGPATAEEALAVQQRSYAQGLERRRGAGVNATVDWPERVPARDEARKMAAWRLDPEALAYARARASLEDTSMSEVLDVLLRQYAAAPPGTWPTSWERPAGGRPVDPELPGR